ncbi:cyclophilin family peptidyl-prolyl cis-trans isomerase, RRM-containing Rct1 [Schizosaccharomyces osmophilus]|uniref:Peptidyl-prolyl cis-trans isomerase n=1 Tax=Schizosaccharomyces osmophilus TaxID=2545709 RepID=A0AAE9W7L4_9SCHI|nr:cyclophilin family peptidyl-prolyl cis-trans isomerase, RRM-containing Rct1 [Schizosaccharomyces osmophilus]WBW70993.1 cyclophilin family peptidyl-prolyl cis-trans isomerase, RRM-containing Rct1 [Schizosaccharomyces osmophilus]
MSVLIETTVGDLVIDLLPEEAPRACENFLKLCKLKYYNFAPFYNIQQNYTCQTGDPIGPTGDGGRSVWNLLNVGDRFFPAEFHTNLSHNRAGTVSMSTVPIPVHHEESLVCGSQFLITFTDHLESLDGRYPIFGRVAEGFDTLQKINEAICDDEGQPFRDIRIKHTILLDDPFPDPPQFIEPTRSPSPTPQQLATVRIGEEERLVSEEDDENKFQREQEQEAEAEAVTLEMVGDLPFAHVAPPENVLFVCKLNPVTQDEDLELIFSRFGKINSCQIIRDKDTGNSLQYAFIEFDNKDSVEKAYFKMQNVLIDDARIHVDFSQSVSRYRQQLRRSQAQSHSHSRPRPRSRSPDYRRRERDNPYPRHGRERSEYKPRHSSPRAEEDREYVRRRKNEDSYIPRSRRFNDVDDDRYYRRRSRYDDDRRSSYRSRDDSYRHRSHREHEPSRRPY